MFDEKKPAKLNCYLKIHNIIDYMSTYQHQNRRKPLPRQISTKLDLNSS